MAQEISDLTVLIIDDEPSVTRLLKMMLNDLKVAQVFVAKDGRDALDFLGSFDDAGVDFIICDWNMPRMSGLDLLKQVRMAYPDLPFLMVTARGTIDSVVAAKKSGVSGYVVKPFSPAELEQKVVALARRIG